MVALPRFTPSLLDHATLEQLFVNREPLLEEVLARIERAARGPERAHKLWVGPRGAGKTHLVSLVYHRARRLAGFGTTFQIAWLPEDPWAVDSLDDLLGEVLDRLEPPVDAQSGRPEDDVVRAARARGPIVVLVENLDQILRAIGSEGQRRLRALLETDRPLLLVATATKLTEYLISQAEPFYGFFDTTTLLPFGVDEAAAMLKAIATLDGDQPLVRRLDEHSGRARLATVEHLAGGQPRVWALLGAGLSIDALDQLVSALLERFDDLTPYYQEQLGRLSSHERAVVRTLADADRAMTVRDLSEATGIAPQSLAKTMTELRRNGWVRPRTGLLASQVDQRLHFYELAEPLVRLAFQLKRSRGEPVRLVVDFLTAWFDRSALVSTEADPSPVGAYLDAARAASAREPVVLLCHGLGGPWSEAYQLAADPTAGWYAPRVLDDNPALATTVAALDDALAALQRGDAVPLLRQPAALSQLMEHRLGSASVTALRIELSDVALGQVVDDPAGWCARAEEVVGSAPEDEAVAALLTLARWHLRAGHDKAADLLVQRVAATVRQDPTPRAVATTVAAAEELIRAGHASTAELLLRAVEPLAPADQLPTVGFALQAVNFRTGRVRATVTLWEEILQRVAASLGPDHPHTLTTRGNLAVSYWWAGRVAEALAIGEPLVGDCERVLGADHPHTLTARGNLAVSYWSAGRVAEALAIGEPLVGDYERVLGPDHPHTLAAVETLQAWRGTPPRDGG